MLRLGHNQWAPRFDYRRGSAGLPFTLNQINIRKGEQKTAAYEKINAFRKTPVLIDRQGPGDKTAIVFASVAICF
jgi:glutathione S-transferase